MACHLGAPTASAKAAGWIGRKLAASRSQAGRLTKTAAAAKAAVSILKMDEASEKA